MRILTIAAALAALIPAAAHAQDWREASVEANGASIFFVDADSIGTPQPRPRARVFMLFAAVENNISAIEALLEFECETGRVRMVTLRSYDADHEPGQEFEPEYKWESPKADSQFGIVGNIACGKAPLSKDSYGSEPPFGAISG